MLRRIYIDNYKCLVNFDLALDELTVLLGPNGVGKSSVLDVVFALRQLLSGVAKITDPEVFPSHTLTRWQSRNIQVVELQADLDGLLITYRLELEHETETRRARVRLERLTTAGGELFRFEGGEVHLFRDDHSPGPSFHADWTESALARVAPTRDNKVLTRFLDFMRRMLICGLYPRSFVTETAREDSLLNRDGSNFAAWYRHVFQERQDLVPGYVAALQDVLEGFAGIRLEKVGQETRAFLAVFREDDVPIELRLDELSDGERALIALYALVNLASGQGYTLLLDEPDNYVALPEIQPWLAALSDVCGQEIPQSIICSHHPEIIDYLGAEHGVLLSREVSGVVIARRLETGTIEGGLRLSEIVARGWER